MNNNTAQWFDQHLKSVKLPSVAFTKTFTSFKDFDWKTKKVVETYIVIDKLGKGGFGSVYRVKKQSNSQQFALKHIELNGDSKELERVTREVRLMLGLKHPSLVKVYNSFITFDNKKKPSALCIVMEILEGLTLRDLMEKIDKDFAVSDRMRMFIDLCKGVEYLHKRGITHRDLKPENIMVVMQDSNIFVKILDLGISVQKNIVQTEMHQIAGTLAYLPPEVLLLSSQAQRVDNKMDVWALGCILFELLTLNFTHLRARTGQPSFGLAQVPPNYITNHIEDSGLLAVLSQLLNRNVKERCDLKSLLEKDLFMKGWQMAVDPSHPGRKDCPSSAAILLPFVSVLEDKNTNNALVHANFSYLKTYFRNPSFREAFIQHGGVEAIGKWINVDLLGGKDILTEALLKAMAGGASSADINLELLKVLQSASNVSATSMLSTLLAYAPHNCNVAVRLYSSAFENIREKVDTVTGASLLTDLLTPNMAKFIEREHGLDFLCEQLLRSDNDDHRRAGTVLFENLLHGDQSRHLLKEYFANLQTKPASRIIYHLGRLCYMRRQPSKTFNSKDDVERLALALRALDDEEVQKQKGIEAWGRRLWYSVVDISDMLHWACNRRVCTKAFTGSLDCWQVCVICETCTDASPTLVSVCLSCALTCHKRHKWTECWPVQRVCECNAEKCSVRPSATTQSSEIKGNSLPQRALTYNKTTAGTTASRPYVPLTDSSNAATLPTYDFENRRVTFSNKFGKYLFVNKGVDFQRKVTAESGAKFYFEIKYERPALGVKRTPAIGVGITVQKSDRKAGMIGWFPGEWGYHSDDGALFVGAGSGSCYGPCYSVGDTIGCGLTADGSLFYTYNGVWLGYAVERAIPTGHYYAAVSCIGYSASVSFVFDFDQFLFDPLSQLLNLDSLSQVFDRTLQRVNTHTLSLFEPMGGLRAQHTTLAKACLSARDFDSIRAMLTLATSAKNADAMKVWQDAYRNTDSKSLFCGVLDAANAEKLPSVQEVSSYGIGQLKKLAQQLKVDLTGVIDKGELRSKVLNALEKKIPIPEERSRPQFAKSSAYDDYNQYPDATSNMPFNPRRPNVTPNRSSLYSGNPKSGFASPSPHPEMQRQFSADSVNPHSPVMGGDRKEMSNPSAPQSPGGRVSGTYHEGFQGSNQQPPTQQWSQNVPWAQHINTARQMHNPTVTNPSFQQTTPNQQFYGQVPLNNNPRVQMVNPADVQAMVQEAIANHTTLYKGVGGEITVNVRLNGDEYEMYLGPGDRSMARLKELLVKDIEVDATAIKKGGFTVRKLRENGKAVTLRGDKSIARLQDGDTLVISF